MKNERLLNAVKDVLYARRAGNVKREQRAYDKLAAMCEKIGVSVEIAMRQGRDWLRNNSVAANMNGLV